MNRNQNKSTLQKNMTSAQINDLFTVINSIPQGPDKDRLTCLIFNSAVKNGFGDDSPTPFKDFAEFLACDRNCSSNITFTSKELKRMSTTFKEIFRTNGCMAHIRKRKSGEGTWNYEIRYRKHGFNVTACANNLEEAKQKFIVQLEKADREGPKPKTAKGTTIPSRLDDFAEYFFVNFYERKVKPETLRISRSQFKNHIAPYFKNPCINKITPKECQELLDRLKRDGKNKTADDVHSILNMIFKAAVKHQLITSNPLDMVFHKQHEREHGTALTKEEEKFLLDSTKGTPQHLMFAVALYTGMRPNEYPTAKIEGKFIVANNSKRKNGKVELKKIPITPMLRPYLDGVTELKFCSQRVIHERFNKILPNHKLYDLRTTFYTRCQECNIAPAARDKFVGHSLGTLGNTYTDLSDEFLLKEGEKFKY